MKPRNPWLFWQAFAHQWATVANGFAIASTGLHCFSAGLRRLCHDLRKPTCYPSPSLRSGPSQAGPILKLRRVNADCVRAARFCFESPRITVESRAITTNQRGSYTCASRFSCSPFLSFRWPVACRIPPRAAWPVPLPVLPSRMRWTKTWLPVRRLAVLPAQQPAVSSWACRPAGRPTDLTASGRAEPSSRTIRAIRPGGPFAFCALGGR
jgi:hypothetical protein